MPGVTPEERAFRALTRPEGRHSDPTFAQAAGSDAMLKLHARLMRAPLPQRAALVGLALGKTHLEIADVLRIRRQLVGALVRVAALDFAQALRELEFVAATSKSRLSENNQSC